MSNWQLQRRVLRSRFCLWGALRRVRIYIPLYYITSVKKSQHILPRLCHFFTYTRALQGVFCQFPKICAYPAQKTILFRQKTGGMVPHGATYCQAGEICPPFPPFFLPMKTRLLPSLSAYPIWATDARASFAVFSLLLPENAPPPAFRPFPKKEQLCRTAPHIDTGSRNVIAVSFYVMPPLKNAVEGVSITASCQSP